MELNERTALIVAHPGHELRIYGWLEEMRPLVFIFTDGSGSSGTSRLDSTTKILNQVGAPVGQVYGRFTDREIYAAILNQDAHFFIALAEELTQSLISEQISTAVGDAAEGYNSTHDVCRLVINAAVDRACVLSGRRIANFQFPLIGPTDSSLASGEQALRFKLDDDMLARKMAAAREYSELSGEVDAALQRLGGIEAFRTECLHSIAPDSDSGDSSQEEIPFYETYGEQQVAAGRYQHVIRYRQHIAPLAAQLRQFAGSC